MSSRGHQVTLVFLDGTDVPPEWRKTPSENSTQPPESQLTQSRPANQPRAVLAKMSRRIGRFVTLDQSQVDQLVADSDVVHLHAPWLLGNSQFANSAVAQGKPYVVTPHGMLDDWSMSQRAMKKRFFMLFKGSKFLNRAACIHCTAQAELDQANKWFRHSRNKVLPYLFDLRPFEHLPGTQLAQQKFPHLALPGEKLLFLSRLHEKKGPDVFLEAAAIVRQSRPGVRIILVGTGEESYEAMLRKKVNELGIHDAVDFLGLVTGVDKLSVYERCDVFVLPTQQENFGLVLIESLACGTPVVTTKAVDIWKEIQSAGGQIVDRKPQAIADAIIKILTISGGRKTLGEMGRNWIFANLQLDKIASEYESFYRDLASKPN